MKQMSSHTKQKLTRRNLLRQAAGAVAAGAVSGGSLAAHAAGESTSTAVRRGRIQQSIAYWCFKDAGDHWDLQKQAQIARRLGCRSIELVEPSDFSVLLENKLICAMTPNGMPGAPFAKGLNNPRYQEEVITRTRQAIDANAAAGFPNVIAFNGYKWVDADDPQSGEIPADEGARNCVAALKKLASYAERKKVTVCIEMLNTRDDSHPMKGHPGYQGDDIDYVADIVQQVASPRVKLLFDIYHVQVMNGDVIRRIRQYREWIGHVHVAGNPGRGELDEKQEINFAACMRALLEINYTGYVGQEFIPTRNPLESLQQAIAECDV